MEMLTIETEVGSIIRSVAGEVLAGAGLALLRGPAGIGKSFALDWAQDEIEANGGTVVRVTAAPAIGGSISAFCRSVLSQYGGGGGSTTEKVEDLFHLLEGYPFRDSGRRVLFMVDEAQELKTAVLETVRSLWDRGGHARLGMVAGPAFGAMLVGNNTFMGKGGNAKTASFGPLLSRVTHNIALARPSQAEHRALAVALFPNEPELQAILAGFGIDAGNLRAQDVAARQARQLAQADKVTEAQLPMAIRMMGGR